MTSGANGVLLVRSWKDPAGGRREERGEVSVVWWCAEPSRPKTTAGEYGPATVLDALGEGGSSQAHMCSLPERVQLSAHSQTDCSYCSTERGPRKSKRQWLCREPKCCACVRPLAPHLFPLTRWLQGPHRHCTTPRAESGTLLTPGERADSKWIVAGLADAELARSSRCGGNHAGYCAVVDVAPNGELCSAKLVRDSSGQGCGLEADVPGICYAMARSWGRRQPIGHTLRGSGPGSGRWVV